MFSVTRLMLLYFYRDTKIGTQFMYMHQKKSLLIAVQYLPTQTFAVTMYFDKLIIFKYHDYFTISICKLSTNIGNLQFILVR